MQKKIIALAVAGLASSGAFAQTNVTIYGTADATFESAQISGGRTTFGGATSTSRNSFTRVSSNSSKIGFKGSEDLGGGLKAIFQVENAVAMDTNGGLVGGRDTFVGLDSSKWGSVKLGLQSAPTRVLGGMIDMNAGATGPGGNSSIIGKTGGIGTGGANATNSGVFDTRFANTISYTSPSISGLSLIAAYVSGENKSVNNAAANAKINTRGYDLGAFYNNGPILVGLTYGKVDNRLSNANTLAVGGTATLDNTSIWRLAGGYTFTGGHKVIAMYERNKNEYDGATVGAVVRNTDLTRNIWGIAGKFMVTPNGGLIVQYYKAQEASGDFLATAVERKSDAQFYEVGYEHSLSKRTMLKASYTRINNQSGANYDFNVGGVNPAAAGPGFGGDPQVIAVGIRHDF